MTNVSLAVTIAVVPVAVAAVLGNLATMSNIPTWYATLTKPSFNPPNWIFGPIWTLLYAMMAYAFFRVLTSVEHRWDFTSVALFLTQIALNAAWSWVFFAGHNPRGGLVTIVALWVVIALTAFRFWQIDHMASVLLWPYLGRVTFATVLNREIVRLNPRQVRRLPGP
jgi:translocator protein